MSKTLKMRNGDVVILQDTGRPYYVEGIEKLSQEVAYFLMLEYNPVRDEGSQLEQLGQRINRPGYLSVMNDAFIRQMVEDCIARLKAKQLKLASQLSPYEMINQVTELRVFRSSKTGYIFYLSVQPVAGPDKATGSFKIELSHQFLGSARAFLPGSINTDDTTI